MIVGAVFIIDRSALTIEQRMRNEQVPEFSKFIHTKERKSGLVAV